MYMGQTRIADNIPYMPQNSRTCYISRRGCIWNISPLSLKSYITKIYFTCFRLGDCEQ